MKKKMFFVLAILIALNASLSAQAKRTVSHNVFSLNYSEHNDGCLVYYESGYYHYRNGLNDGIEHRNNNAQVRADINLFNKEIERLDAVPDNDQQLIFNSTPIGSWYFVYRINYENGRSSFMMRKEGRGNFSNFSETFVIYHCNIWKVDVVADR